MSEILFLDDRGETVRTEQPVISWTIKRDQPVQSGPDLVSGYIITIRYSGAKPDAELHFDPATFSRFVDFIISNSLYYESTMEELFPQHFLKE